MSTKPTETSSSLIDDTDEARLVPLCEARRASQARATSNADLPKAPSVSKQAVNSITPVIGMEPGVSLSAYRAATAAGDTMDPEVSVPTEIWANPEATPTADPVEEPAGVYKQWVNVMKEAFLESYSFTAGFLSDLVTSRDIRRFAHPPNGRPPTHASVHVSQPHDLRGSRSHNGIGLTSFPRTPVILLPRGTT